MGWDTRERIARRYGLVKRFTGKWRNEGLDGGEGGVNGASLLVGEARNAKKRLVSTRFEWVRALQRIRGRRKVKTRTL